MTRVTRLPGDHSQVGWLPPSSVPYHYSEKDSSPLTRGKRRRFREWPGRTRLIPAHAGKTRQCPPWFPDRTAHPRSRGENSLRFFARVTRAGSSPLTRGKRVRPHQRGCARGLIPAHAGKTGGECGHHLVAPAHPRSRGENVVRENLCRNPSGSSPLTRGKPVRVGHAYWWSGLIPAHAGKTSSLTDRQTPRPAHPRSRGENRAAAEQAVRAVGSSPLTRGKRAVATTDEARNRLIPAHAGKTSMTDRSPSKHTAHPRSRGENGAWCGRRVFSMGSSPLTRGKLAPPSGRGHHGGAHPRSRGENQRSPHVVGCVPGSSPLTRGKPP